MNLAVIDLMRLDLAPRQVIETPYVTTAVHRADTVNDLHKRSTAMYALNEALAREHRRGLQRQSRQVNASKRAAAERRYLRLQRQLHRTGS